MCYVAGVLKCNLPDLQQAMSWYRYTRKLIPFSSGLYVRASQYLFCLYRDIHLHLLLLTAVILYAEVDIADGLDLNNYLLSFPLLTDFSTCVLKDTLSFSLTLPTPVRYKYCWL